MYNVTTKIRLIIPFHPMVFPEVIYSATAITQQASNILNSFINSTEK